MTSGVLPIAFLCLPFAVFADVTVVQKMTSAQPKDMVLTETIYAKNNKGRINFAPGEAYLLMDLHEQKTLFVYPPKKEISLFRSKWNATGNFESLVHSKPKVKTTGQVKTINGFNCKEYIWSITMPNSVQWIVDYWVTADIDRKEFEPFIPYTHIDFELPNIEDLMTIEGFPIVTEMKFVGKMINEVGFRTEVQSVTHDTIPDSVFLYPKEYKIIDRTPSPESMPAPDQGD